MLDLVKAFDKVQQWLLLREAIALGYPLKLLRLSIATYQLKRLIRVGCVMSEMVMAALASLQGQVSPRRR